MVVGDEEDDYSEKESLNGKMKRTARLYSQGLFRRIYFLYHRNVLVGTIFSNGPFDELVQEQFLIINLLSTESAARRSIR